MSNNIITEVISEFTVDVQGLNHIVKGRVEKTFFRK